MARQRTWNLRLNVDEFNNAFAKLNGAGEESDFLRGLWKALNSGILPGGASDPSAAGFDFGVLMMDEAEAFRERAAQAGSKGGFSKAARVATLPLHRTLDSSYTVPSSQNVPNPQSFNYKQQTTTEPPSAAEPPRPPKGRKPKATASMMGEEFQSFLDLVWKPYPSRRRVGTDELMGKGKQQEAFQRAKDLLKREGKDWVWLGQVVQNYPNHPNAKNGYIQQVEVFLGEKGHWLECASRLQRDGQLRQALDGSGHRSLPALHPSGGDSGTETLPVLEAQCSDRGGPEGPSLYLPALRG
jgi:hypothetical protein